MFVDPLWFQTTGPECLNKNVTDIIEIGVANLHNYESGSHSSDYIASTDGSCMLRRIETPFPSGVLPIQFDAHPWISAFAATAIERRRSVLGTSKSVHSMQPLLRLGSELLRELEITTTATNGCGFVFLG